MPFPAFTSATANTINRRSPVPPPQQPKVLPALALQQLSTLFPTASSDFLEWSISHHLANSSSHPKSSLTVERIVARVSEKIVDGLGDLYPRKGRQDSVDGLNEQLTTLASIYPSHPIALLRSLLSHPSHSPAPLHLTAYTLLHPLSPISFGSGATQPRLLPHPRPSLFPALSKHTLFRSESYKSAVRLWLKETYPSLSSASIAALLAEENHDWTRTKEACERLMSTRSVAGRIWGSLTASLKSLTSSSASSSSSSIMRGGKKGREQADQGWRACPELLDEMWDEGSLEREKLVEKDAQMAREWNEKEYEREGQSIECSCCFGEEAWEDMGGCEEGHLICSSCINTHVSVLLPTLSFPVPSHPSDKDDYDATSPSSTPSSPPTGTLIPCPSCVPPCSAFLPLSTLTSHLTPSNLKSYNSTISSAFSRSILQFYSASSSSNTTAKKCPFCPYTILIPLPLPLIPASSSAKTIFSPFLMLHRVLLFFTVMFLFSTLLSPSPLSLLAPATAWKTVLTHHDTLIEGTKLLSSGTIFRCLNIRGSSSLPPGMMGSSDDSICGRESCLACGKEVWGGVACRCCHDGITVGDEEGGDAGKGKEKGKEENEEEKSKEELRLAVERAMSEAMIRTCPKCELGFTKLDSCNKMTCPRDGYKMCYVCRADVATEGYQHFCPHFRVIPGPCRECTKCDLYLLPDADQTIQAAGDAARRVWLAKSTAAGKRGKDWVRGVRVGPRTDAELAIEKRRIEIDNLFLSHLGHLAALASTYETWHQIFLSDPLCFISILVQVVLSPFVLVLFLLAIPFFGPIFSLLLS